MSSPGARQRRRRQQYQSPHSRADIVTAVSVAVGIVAVSALMIWLLRPGGLADRQPRSSWLIGLALGLALVAAYLVLRPTSRFKRDRRLNLGGALGIILIVALAAGFKWPGGLLRHPLKIPPVVTTPTNTTTVTLPPGAPTTAGSPTSTPTATTLPGTPTTAPTATTTPGTPTSSPTATSAPGATTKPTATTTPHTSTTVKPPPVSPVP
jgi:hypothetical protein